MAPIGIVYHKHAQLDPQLDSTRKTSPQDGDWPKALRILGVHISQACTTFVMVESAPAARIERARPTSSDVRSRPPQGAVSIGQNCKVGEVL